MDEYFDWLMRRVDASNQGNYYFLLHTMYEKEFYPVVVMDENRESDGLGLREGFDHSGPCTVLEVMVAIAHRISEDIYPGEPTWGDNVPYWFWVMVDNLGLKKQTNERFDREEVLYILDRFVNREYEFDGRGGLFPRKNAEKDQRDVEIWYQMHGYLMENYGI